MPVSPISRIGGKFRLAPKIVSMFPEHKRYIEPFGGAMHVLFKKQPAEFEVYNDLDSRLVNFFKCVRCYPDELVKLLDYSLYSRENFLGALRDMDNGTEIDRAAHFYLVNRQSFGGNNRQWGITLSGSNGFFTYEQRIRQAHERLKKVYIENRDYCWIIEKYDSPDALFYLDPPYIFNENRSKSKVYQHEMTDADHAELVELLKGVKGKFVLSGYGNDLYDCFERVSVGQSAMNINMTVGKPRTYKDEYVWKNF